MKKYTIALVCLICIQADARVGSIKEVDLPETQVIAVKTANGGPPAYAEAFGKLVGYYAQPTTSVKVVFPQRSVTINGASYAAVAVSSPPANLPVGVELLALPSCHFLSARYTGSYDGLGPSIEAIVNVAIGKKFKINQSCGVRIHHLNSPDNTPIDKLEHVLYVPVARAKT